MMRSVGSPCLYLDRLIAFRESGGFGYAGRAFVAAPPVIPGLLVHNASI
jgi:hypothetical protein